jgi:putative hemolysin
MSTDSTSTEDEPRSSPRIARRLGSRLTTLLRRFGAMPITEEDIKVLLREGLEAGVFEEVEHEIVERVFRLSDLRASQLMTPMKSVVWLDVADPPEVMQQKITESPHTRFPVCEGSIDSILGVVHIKDLLIQCFTGKPFSVKGLLKMPLLIYEGTPGLKALEMFKKLRLHIAVVLDEYGSVRGLLTVTDILEAIVGEMPVGEAQE